MTIRIKFAKYGNLRFLSHLDIMRFFQKAIRRADLDVAYTEGFHPHQIMSFAAPLGVGQTSEGEYFDLELNTFTSEADVMTRLNAQMPEGFKVLHITVLPDRVPQTKRESIMALVKASDYLIFRNPVDKPFLTNEEFFDKFMSFVQKDEIKTIKSTKAGDNEIDIAPFIYGFKSGVSGTELSGDGFVQGFSLYLLLSAGSENHIRPELLLKAFYESEGLTFNPYEFRVHRLEAYTRDSEGQLLPIYRLHEKSI